MTLNLEKVLPSSLLARSMQNAPAPINGQWPTQHLKSILVDTTSKTLLSAQLVLVTLVGVSLKE